MGPFHSAKILVGRRSPQEDDLTYVSIHSDSKRPSHDCSTTSEVPHHQRGNHVMIRGPLGIKAYRCLMTTCQTVTCNEELGGAVTILTHISKSHWEMDIPLQGCPFWLILESRFLRWETSLLLLRVRLSHSANNNTFAPIRPTLLSTIDPEEQPISDKTVASNPGSQPQPGLEYVEQFDASIQARVTNHLDEFTVEIEKLLNKTTGEPEVAKFNPLRDIGLWLSEAEDCYDRSLLNGIAPEPAYGKVDDDVSFTDSGLGSDETASSTPSLCTHQQGDDVAEASIPDKTSVELSKKSDFVADSGNKILFHHSLHRWLVISDSLLKLVDASSRIFGTSSSQPIGRNTVTIAHKESMETSCRLLSKVAADYEAAASRMDKHDTHMVKSMLRWNRSATAYSLKAQSGIIHSIAGMGQRLQLFELIRFHGAFFETSDHTSMSYPGDPNRFAVSMVGLSEIAGPPGASASVNKLRNGIKAVFVEGLQHTATNPLPLTAQDADSAGNGNGASSRETEKRPSLEKRPVGRGVGKRDRIQDDSDGYDCSDNDDHDRRPKSTKTEETELESETGLLFACPFWKNDPEKHPDCFFLRLKTTGRVKQHLKRQHFPKYPCYTCKNPFATKEDFSVHIKEKKCKWRESARLDCMDNDQRERIARRSNFKQKSAEQIWYDIWEILFDNKPRPSSPYMNQMCWEDVYRFAAFCRREAPIVLRQELSNDPCVNEVGKEAPRTEHCLESTLWRVIRSLIDGWLSVNEMYTNIPDFERRGSLFPNQASPNPFLPTDKHFSQSRGSDSGLPSIWSAGGGNQASDENFTTVGTETKTGRASTDRSGDNMDEEISTAVVEGAQTQLLPSGLMNPDDVQGLDPYSLEGADAHIPLDWETEQWFERLLRAQNSE